MTIAADQVVSIHYTLTEVGGDLIDSSAGGDPLVFLFGHGQIIAGLEAGLLGKKVGDKFLIEIPPEDAYGVTEEEAVITVPISVFEDQSLLEVGAQLELDTDGGPAVVTVVEVGDKDVILDGNHPLAGMTLSFDVEVIAIRDATEEELEHGHAHDGHVH